LVGQAGGLQVVYTPAFELMIEASPLADKSRVIELIKKGREEQEHNQVQQLTQTVQQLQQQLEQMNKALQQQAVSTGVEAAKIDETHARNGLASHPSRGAGQ
jgi:phenylalanyl-tRNA synthetase alpha subunit